MSPQRTMDRLSLTLRTRVSWSDGELSGFSTDLSHEGIFVETSAAVPKNTPVRVEFALMDRGQLTRIVAEGKVVRGFTAGSESGWSPISGVGIRFENFVFGGDLLDRYVTEQAAAVKASAEAIGAERRGSARVTVGLNAFWGTASPPDHEGFVSDLSASGCFVIQTVTAEPVGSTLHLWFELPMAGSSTAVRAAGKVVRVLPSEGDRPAGMGIHFDPASLEMETADDLIRFVNLRLAWDAMIQAERTLSGAEWPQFEETSPPAPSPYTEGHHPASSYGSTREPTPLPTGYAQDLGASGVRWSVISRMLVGTLSVAVVILLCVVLFLLKLHCAAPGVAAGVGGG
jgi:hypothetical protein